MSKNTERNELSKAEIRKKLHRLTENVEDEAILRRVWKMLERAYAANAGTGEGRKRETEWGTLAEEKAEVGRIVNELSYAGVHKVKVYAQTLREIEREREGNADK